MMLLVILFGFLLVFQIAFRLLWSAETSTCPVKSARLRQKRPLLPHSYLSVGKEEELLLSPPSIPPPYPGLHQHELSALIMLRVFPEDMLKFSRDEIDQWMAYMSFAGVTHFYVYDNCLREAECQTYLSKHPNITYTRWSVPDYKDAQTPAYNHHWQTHFPQSRYEILLDVDEYPFMPNDTKEDFLLRYVLQRDSGQLLLRTMFFGGKADSNHSHRAMRYRYRRAEPHEPEARTKPIYRPELVDYHNPINLHQVAFWPGAGEELLAQKLEEHPSEKQGGVVDDLAGVMPMFFDWTENPNVIRLNHYWCERLIDEDPKATVFDDSIHNVLDEMKAANRLGYL